MPGALCHSERRFHDAPRERARCLRSILNAAMNLPLPELI
jgi:hypothetical protein